MCLLYQKVVSFIMDIFIVLFLKLKKIILVESSLVFLRVNKSYLKTVIHSNERFLLKRKIK